MVEAGGWPSYRGKGWTFEVRAGLRAPAAGGVRLAPDLYWYLMDGRKHGSLWEGGWENRGERDAAEEAGHAEVWQGRKGWTGDEQEAGDCDWAFGGAEEGREGSAEEIQLIARCPRRAGCST